MSAAAHPWQEYWSGLPFSPPGDLPDLGIKPTSPVSPALQVDSLPAEPSGKPVCDPTLHYYLPVAAAAAAKSLQSCPTLRDPIDGSPPGSPVPGILLARTLQCIAISFSSAWKWKVKVKSLSCVRPSATPWTAALQAPLFMGFSRQEYWSGMPSPSPGDLPNPGIEPGSPALQADALPSEPPGKPYIIFEISAKLMNAFQYPINAKFQWLFLCEF